MASLQSTIDKFLYPVAKSLLEVDFFKRQMQFSISAGGMASGSAAMLWTGIPVFDPATSAGTRVVECLVPIGGLMGYQIQESQAVAPIFENGSRLPRYGIASAGQYFLNINRLLTKNSNLLYTLYAWLPKFMNNDPTGTLPLTLELALPPGANNSRHFSNPDSDIFDIPFGMLAIVGSASGDAIRMEYLEFCSSQGNSNNFAAGSPTVADSGNIQIGRITPFVKKDGDAWFTKVALTERKSYVMAGPFKK